MCAPLPDLSGRGGRDRHPAPNLKCDHGFTSSFAASTGRSVRRGAIARV